MWVLIVAYGLYSSLKGRQESSMAALVMVNL